MPRPSALSSGYLQENVQEQGVPNPRRVRVLLPPAWSTPPCPQPCACAEQAGAKLGGAAPGPLFPLLQPRDSFHFLHLPTTQALGSPPSIPTAPFLLGGWPHMQPGRTGAHWDPSAGQDIGTSMALPTRARWSGWGRSGYRATCQQPPPPKDSRFRTL